MMERRNNGKILSSVKPVGSWRESSKPNGQALSACPQKTALMEQGFNLKRCKSCFQ